MKALLGNGHRAVGLRYLLLSLAAVIFGTLLSLLMRLHLVWPGLALPLWGFVRPEDYLALVTLHGTLMLFFVLTLAPQAGFGNLILPAQIGAMRTAFPALNSLGCWTTTIALLVLLASPFVPGGSSIAGWTAYPPLSALSASGPGMGAGMDLWLISIGLFCLGAIANSINLLVTTVTLRCPGMTWRRLPLTVWSWFTAALLTVLAFSVLLCALAMLLLDRHAGTSFFIPHGDLVNGTAHLTGNGNPLLWLHLFWFFGHPEVYIAILPGMGLTSMILADFARRRVVGYRLMIATTLLIGFLGIFVWGHHMFVAGLNPFAGLAFSISTMAIAIPGAAKVFSWIATLWGSRPSFPTPMLFALGFVSLFVAGGLTGPVLAQPALDQYLHNTYFVVAHFHLIMAMAGVFGLFAALSYWFPLLSGCRLNETLGRWHFWLTFLGAWCVFLPMHVAGLMGSPRHYAQFTGIVAPAAHLLAATIPIQRFITWSAFCLASAQILFLINLVHSWKRGQLAPPNPWNATTLEWHAAPEDEPVSVYRAPCDYIEGVFHPQWAAHTKAE